MIATAAAVAMGIVSVSALLVMVRLLRGPTYPDRVAAVDTLGVHAMAMFALFAVYSGVSHYLDAVVLLALVGFLATVAAAKYFLQGVPIDHDDT